MNPTSVLTFGGTSYDLEDHRIPSIVDAIYPIGSIYMSVNPANPSTLFGGTWERIEDAFLLAAGQNYTAGDTGGEASHTLTASELPQHTHWANGNSQADNGDWTIAKVKSTSTSGVLPVAAGTDRIAPATVYDSEAAWSNVSLSAQTGGVTVATGTAHNNLPPYLAVYVWKRTA